MSILMFSFLHTDYPSNIWWAVQIRELIIMRFSAAFYFQILFPAPCSQSCERQQAKLQLCVLICIFIDSRWKDRRFWIKHWPAFSIFHLLLIYSSVQFSFASIISKYMNLVTLLGNVYVVILSYILTRNMNSFLCINFHPVYNRPR
jgi:hypothetical protein